jgi:hypothetical protein
MQIIDNKIHIIENYISKDSAKLIVDSFKNSLNKAPRDLFLTGPNFGPESAYKIGPSNPIAPYENNVNKNIAIDMITMLCQMMSKTISDFYNKEYILKTFCYQLMQEGARNPLHSDNYYYNKDGKVIERETEKNDKSGLLYLSEDHEGGEIYFPAQNFTLVPKAGMFVFFEGNLDVLHEVKTITKGDRHNLVSFFWPSENAGKSMVDIPPNEEIEFPYPNQ